MEIDTVSIESAEETAPKAQKSMSIAVKFYGVVGLCLTFMVGIASISYWQMGLIGTEIESIAERDVPTTNALTKITVHVLEQEISMEKAFRYGDAMKTDSHAAELFEKSANEFEKLNVKITGELKAAEKLMTDARDHAANDAERSMFAKAYDTTVKIEKAHKGFHDQTAPIFTLIRDGNLSEAHKREEQIEATAKKLNHEIEGLLLNFESYTEKAAKTAEAHEKFAIKLIAIVSIIAIIGAGLIAFFLVQFAVARPLRNVVSDVDALTGGDFDREIIVSANDEIGKVASALLTFRDTMVRAKQLEEEQKVAQQKAQEEEQQRQAAEQEAERKETERQQQEAAERQKRADRMAEIIASFDTQISTVVETLSSAATEMQSSAETMSATADQTSKQATAVAAASEEASTNVQTVASAAEELSASVEEINRQVTQSNKISQEAVAEAKLTNEKVEGLAEAAQKIGDVVNLINDIASQTNLLALNATIEAARAGEAGKGFAVVASEVKSLATQTSKATDEIGAQITAIQAATADAVQAIQGIGTTIGEIGEIATSVSTAVEQQGSATREIAGSVQQAAAGTQEVSSNIIQVTQAAGETQTSSGQMLDAAKELAQQGNVLRTEVDKFLEDVRAA